MPEDFYVKAIELRNSLLMNIFEVLDVHLDVSVECFLLKPASLLISTIDFVFFSSDLIPPPEMSPTETWPLEKLEKLSLLLSSSNAEDALLILLWMG